MRDDKRSTPAAPTLTQAGAQDAAERRRRQARALRANLARRKARDRALDAAAGDREPATEPLETQDVSERPGGLPGKA